MAKRNRRKTSEPSDEELLGPPPREATIIRDDRERQADNELEEHTSTSPQLSGGDVDGLGDALGVPRAPDEEIRTSDEILEARDRNRWEQEDTPDA